MNKKLVVGIVVVVAVIGGVGISVFRKHSGTVSVSTPNPFQSFYDFLPQGGEFQTCLKRALGDDFSAAYNGGTLPVSKLELLEKCGDPRDPKTYKNLPVAAQKCFQDALGEEFAEIMSDPSRLGQIYNSKELNDVENCPAVQEFLTEKKELTGYFMKQQAQLVLEQLAPLSTPSFPASIDLSDREAVLAALRGLDTSKNYYYNDPDGVSYSPQGFMRPPTVAARSGQPSIKLAVNGSRGPLVLKAPASVVIQAWIDPAEVPAGCQLWIPNAPAAVPVKSGELITEKVDNLARGEYDVSLDCAVFEIGSDSSEVEVWVFE